MNWICIRCGGYFERIDKVLGPDRDTVTETSVCKHGHTQVRMYRLSDQITLENTLIWTSPPTFVAVNDLKMEIKPADE